MAPVAVLEAKKQAFIAQAWQEDLGDDTPEPMQNLARLGNGGRSAQNTFRDISRKLQNWRNVNPDIMYMRLPIVLNKKQTWVKFPFISIGDPRRLIVEKEATPHCKVCAGRCAPDICGECRGHAHLHCMDYCYSGCEGFMCGFCVIEHDYHGCNSVTWPPPPLPWDFVALSTPR